jgi:hypothetical protein
MQKFIFAVLVAVSMGVQAQQPPQAVAVKATAPGKVGAAEAIEVRARVVGIDKATRSVDLRKSDGKVVTIAAGDEVKNFDQIKLGDDLVVRYVRALSLELLKSGSAVREGSEKTDAVRAKAGDKPGAAAGRQVTVIANIVAINKKAKTVTLKGPKGNMVDLIVEDPKQIALAKVGDQVEAVYTEAVAISVEAAPKAAKKTK